MTLPHSLPTLSKIYNDLNNVGGVICGQKSLSSCPFVRPLSPYLSIYFRLSAPFCLSFTFCVCLSLLLSLSLSVRDSLALYFNARPIVLSPLAPPPSIIHLGYNRSIISNNTSVAPGGGEKRSSAVSWHTRHKPQFQVVPPNRASLHVNALAMLNSRLRPLWYRLALRKDRCSLKVLYGLFSLHWIPSLNNASKKKRRAFAEIFAELQCTAKKTIV